MKTRSISSGTVFKTLTDLGSQPASSAGVKLNGKEVKAALDSFNWDDQSVSKTEVIAARMAYDSLKSSGKLTTDGAQAFNDWFTAVGAGQPGGFTFDRTSVALQDLRSFFQNPDSQKGGTFTKAEAAELVSILGEPPAAARVADIAELYGQLKGSGKSHDAQTVLNDWVKAHPIAQPAEPLGSALKTAVKDLYWPSETDRPLYPVDLGKAPTNPANLSSIRNALNEPASAHVEVRDFDQTFAELTTVQDVGDPRETARAEQFAKLRDALKAHLTDLQLVRVGDISIDVYALGKDPSGHWVGVMSGVVET